MVGAAKDTMIGDVEVRFVGVCLLWWMWNYGYSRRCVVVMDVASCLLGIRRGDEV